MVPLPLAGSPPDDSSSESSDDFHPLPRSLRRRLMAPLPDFELALAAQIKASQDAGASCCDTVA